MARGPFHPASQEPLSSLPPAPLQPAFRFTDVPETNPQDGAIVDLQAIHPNMRQCSVRGCNVMLPPEYPQRMCDVCRSRHRVYASTKRRKRKMEKQAIGGQLGSVVWMPPNSDEREEQPEAGPSSQPAGAPETDDQPHPAAPHYPDWDESIDPSLYSQDHSAYSQSHHPTAENNVAYTQDLAYPPAETFTDHQHAYFQDQNGHPFSQNSDPGGYSQNTNSYSQGPSPYTQHSELAGALQLPQHHAPSHQVPQTSQPVYHPPHMQTSSPLDEHHVYQEHPDDSQAQAQLSQLSVHPTEDISNRSISEIASDLGQSDLPHRFCSVKGCKALIPGDSFFKMCEPCRNRYRSYGTTKRAKWKREKEAAVAELHVNQGEGQSSTGLPPSNNGEWPKQPQPHIPQTPHPPMPDPSFAPQLSNTPRMCTVSHCREVLPPDYPFLRCERHRIQNRHHSKLKRVRDKENKAAAFQDWTPPDGMNGQEGPPEEEGHSPFAEEEPEEEVKTNYYDQVLPEAETSVPPAARGSRRTNNVCSIKSCCNLLSPYNPWKMCDSCRDRDRAVRRNKALRDSGFEVEPLPPKPRTPPPPDGPKKKKKSGKKQAQVQSQVVPAQGDEGQVAEGSGQSQTQMQVQGEVGQSGELMSAVGSDNTMVFMNPLAPPAEHQNAFASQQPIHDASTNITQSPPVATNQDHVSVEPEPRPTPAGPSPSTQQATPSSTSVPVPQPALAAPTPTTAAITQPVHPYPFPYYAMSPYMTPYPAARYPTYATPPVMSVGVGVSMSMTREGYAPSPIFQPAYPGYPPYAYPWSPWGPTPHFSSPVAIAAAPTQMTTSVTSQAVSQQTSGPQQGTNVTPTAGSTSAPAQAVPQEMLTTFSSKPAGDSPNTSSTLQPAAAMEPPPPPGPPPDHSAVAFIVKPASSAPSASSSSPAKRKRVTEPEGVNKRHEVAASSGSGNAGMVGQQQQQQPAPVSAPAVPGPTVVQYPSTTSASFAIAAANGTSAGAASPALDGKRLTCTNKSCNRALPAGTSGMCEKCKDKIRKKKDVAKRRAKLEPRNLVGSTTIPPTAGKVAVHGLHS